MESDTKNTPVVEVSVEVPLDVSMEGNDGPVWDEAPEVSVETRPIDCASVNWRDRDPVYKKRGVLNLGVLIDSLWGRISLV